MRSPRYIGRYDVFYEKRPWWAGGHTKRRGPMGAVTGAVIEASPGAAFGGWRRIIVLAAAARHGARRRVLVGSLLRASLPMISGVEGIAAPEVVGGASTGAIIGGLTGRGGSPGEDGRAGCSADGG